MEVIACTQHLHAIVFKEQVTGKQLSNAYSAFQFTEIFTYMVPFSHKNPVRQGSILETNIY